MQRTLAAAIRAGRGRWPALLLLLLLLPLLALRQSSLLARPGVVHYLRLLFNPL